MENKTTKEEKIQADLDADIIKETANEVNDGKMDAFIMDNYEILVGDFLNDYNDEWVEFCKIQWREHNE